MPSQSKLVERIGKSFKTEEARVESRSWKFFHHGVEEDESPPSSPMSFSMDVSGFDDDATDRADAGDFVIEVNVGENAAANVRCRAMQARRENMMSM